MTSFLTDRNVIQIRRPTKPEPSIVNEKTIADFTRVAENTGILKHAARPAEPASVSSD